MKKTRLSGLLLMLTLMLALMLGLSATAYAEGHIHQDAGGNPITFVPWTDELAKQQNGAGKTAANSLPSVADSYYLTEDVELQGGDWSTGAWVVSNEINLCLNGHSITNLGDGPVIQLNSYSSETPHLALFDEDGDTGKITHAKDKGGEAVSVSDGTFDMYGGSISGNQAIYISGNHAFYSNAAGVYLSYYYTEFNMYGGKITGNTGASGVYLDGSEGEGGTFNMYGGEISNNTAASAGGGVYMWLYSTFNMKGGKISGNTAPQGGGVYASGNDSEFNMSDGEISGNTATEAGGGVYHAGSLTFNLAGGKIIDNVVTATATGDPDGLPDSGGGVFYYIGYYKDGAFNLSGNPTITGNRLGEGDDAVDNNVYLYLDPDYDYESKITFNGELTNTTPIGITAKAYNNFTSGWKTKMGDAAPDKFFTSDDTEHSVALVGDELQLGDRTESNIYMDNMSNGSVTATVLENGSPVFVDSNKLVENGTDVTLTVSPNTGYVLRRIYYTEGAGTDEKIPTKTGTDTYTLSMPQADVTVHAIFAMPVTYLDANGDEQTCIDYEEVRNSNAAVQWGVYGEDHWYVVTGEKAIGGQISLEGNVHLILRDGAKLTTKNGINITSQLPDSIAFTIYAQSRGGNMGRLIAKSTDDPNNDAIRADFIVINGGDITATGTDAAAINAYGFHGTNGLTINGGIVTASTSWGSAIYFDKSLTLASNLIVKAGNSETEALEVNDFSTNHNQKWVQIAPNHKHQFTSFNANGATITAECDHADGACTLTEYKATLTIAANDGTFDGSEKPATIEDPDGILGDVKVQYAKKNDDTTYGGATDTAPKDAGTYRASVTLGGATASVEYTIGKATLTGVSVTQNGTLTYSGQPQTPAVDAAATAVAMQTVEFTYSKTQDGAYGDMPTVTNVADGGTFYYKATAPNHKDSTGEFTVTMDKAKQDAPGAPTLASATDTTITLKEITNGQYRMETDGAWRDSPVFTGLTKNETYTFSQRYKEDENHSASPASSSESFATSGHTHDWGYQAEGARLTATCQNTDTPHQGEMTATLTIHAPALTTYGETGKDANATIEGSIEGVPNPEIVYRKGDTMLDAAPTDAGTYTASITLDNATASVEYTIYPAVTTVTTSPTAAEITYGQTLESSALTGGSAVLTGSSTEVEGTFAWEESVKTTAPKVSDSQITEYDVVFTPTSTNYATAVCTVTLTVNKADRTVTKAPTGKNVIYDGSAQALVEPGQTSDGTMVYALGDEAHATSNYNANCTATDAGTYYVWYKVEGDANHNGSEPARVKATIAARTMDVTVTGVNTTYDGQAHSAAVTVTEPQTNYKVEYRTAPDGNYVEENPSMTNVGKMTVYYRVTAPNYEETLGQTTVVISPATMNVSAAGDNATYDGQGHGITVTVTEPATGATVTYGETKGTYEQSVSPTQTDVGTKTVFYKVTAPNYADYEDSATVTVSATDKGTLSETIKAAQDYHTSIKENAQYADVATNLNSAITDAQAVANNDNVTAQAVTNALTAIQAALDTAKSKVADIDAAKAVTDQINALPAATEVKATDKAAIEAARKAYNALTTDQKNLVSDDTLKKLTDAEAALTTAQADADKAQDVENKIAALPTAENVKTTDKEAIEAARQAYNALTEAQKKLVGQTGLNKLSSDEAALEKALTDANAANTAETTLKALPAAADVKTTDKAAIDAARKAYNDLTYDQKQLVSADLLKKLEDAEKALTTAQSNLEAANDAADQIAALPAAADVKTTDQKAIEAARKAYDALTDDQKKLVSDDTLKKLTDAEAALKTAQADAEKAKSVEDQIAALPTAANVKTSDKAAIEAARQAYDALTEAQKKLVSDAGLNKLTDDETALTKAQSDADAAKTVADKIAALPASTDVKATDQAAIDAALQAYNDLTYDQKKLVSADALKKLEDAEKALTKAESDADEAKSAQDKIAALPEAANVKTTDRKAIEAARKAYDELTDDQKKLVSADALKKLEDAEKALTKAQSDADAAKAAQDKIAALPEAANVKSTDKEAIDAARKAYNDLTDDQKKLVSADALKKLEAAEEALGKSGEIKEEVHTHEGAPKTRMDMSDGTAEDLLTPQEKAQKEAGTTVLVYLDVTNIDDTVSEAEKALAIAAAQGEDNNAQLATVLDLSLFKQVGDAQPEPISEVSKAVTTTITIPEDLRKAGRWFFVVRIHEGQTAIVGEGSGDSVTVKSDLFSTYAIFYVDRTEPEPEAVRSIILYQKGNNPTETVQLGEKVTVVPMYASAEGWPVSQMVSSSRKVAAINPETGELTLNKAGKTTIRVTAKNGRKKVYARVRLNVVDPAIPKLLKIDQGKEIAVAVGKDASFQLTVTAEPKGVASNEVTWKSSKKTVVTVDANGRLTPKKAGSAKITATSKRDKKRKATITVNVLDSTIPTGITLSTETDSTMLKEGDAVQLKYELIGPDEDVPAESDVTWKSKQTKIAKVSKDGVVTALRSGTVEIVASTKRGKASASITLIVKSADASLENGAEIEAADDEPAVTGNVEEVVEDTTAELTED